jgi:hypothetical protein
MATITYVGTLTIINCGKCQIRFAIPESMYDHLRQTGETWWCPNGHPRGFRESENAKLKKSLAAARSRATHLADQLQATELSRRATKGHLTRIRNRIANGVCPWCQRSFTNVRAHVTSQHPDYADTMTEALA